MSRFINLATAVKRAGASMRELHMTLTKGFTPRSLHLSVDVDALYLKRLGVPIISGPAGYWVDGAYHRRILYGAGWGPGWGAYDIPKLVRCRFTAWLYQPVQQARLRLGEDVTVELFQEWAALVRDGYR